MLISLLLLAAISFGPTLAAAAQPNVVIFLTDDQGYGDLGFHSNQDVRTPNMDAFARASVEFTQFYVSPVCAPTRASLMTGRYNFRTGVTDVFNTTYFMDPGEVTIAEALKTAGYATGIFGKWHLGESAPHSPSDQGFAESLVHERAAMGKYFDPVLVHNGVKKPFKGYCMDVFTDHAIEFIQRHRTEPFFLYLAPNLIHTPLQIDEAHAAPFRARGLDEKTSKVYGMLESVDENFGRVMAALKKFGLEENTLVIFFADNGPCTGSVTPQRFMAGLRGLKGTPFENGIRVGSFMRWPGGFSSPARVDRIAAHLDIMPTVLEACGVNCPPGVQWDGKSLMPLLRHPERIRRWPERTLFFQWDSGSTPRRGHAFAVRNQQYKLVQPCGMDDPKQQHIRNMYTTLCADQGRGPQTMEGPPQYLLFDISRDPGETKDLAADHPEIVTAMKKQYNAWFDSVCAHWLSSSK